MKNIVIAAGYATRLGELTRNFPKPLLQIGESTILGRMLDDIDKIPEIDEHIIITNHRFASIFEEWASGQNYTKPVTVVDDGTSTNETRLGAVCDLLFAMEKLGLDDDLLVVAADNILMFSFKEFVDFAREKDSSCIMCHHQPSIERLQRTGVVLLDEKGSEFRSIEYAEWLQKRMNSGIKRLVFVIGGPYGFSEAVYSRSNEKISLSKMTFSHQIIRAIFTEQLYRAFSIINNSPYHHE